MLVSVSSRLSGSVLQPVFCGLTANSEPDAEFCGSTANSELTLASKGNSKVLVKVVQGSLLFMPTES